MIRIFVIEDQHLLTVSGLRNMFRPSRDNIEFLGYFLTVEEAIATAKPEAFDIFVLDLWLPDKKPIENIQKLLQFFPGKGIVIYTSDSSSAWKQRMMKEGAMAYLTKTASREDIKMAIEKASNGERFFTGAFDELDIAEIIQSTQPAKKTISPIHREMLFMLKEGRNHREIAKWADLKPSQVEKVFKAFRKQYGAKNNMHLVSILIERKEI
jgi:DNA-binding NarL/FixJ family response regulator